MAASQVIGTLVSDQKSQDASLEQNWVNLADGSQTQQGNDLAAAVQSLASYAARSSPQTLPCSLPMRRPSFPTRAAG